MCINIYIYIYIYISLDEASAFSVRKPSLKRDMGPAPRDFELSKGSFRPRQAMVLGFEPPTSNYRESNSREA